MLECKKGCCTAKQDDPSLPYWRLCIKCGEMFNLHSFDQVIASHLKPEYWLLEGVPCFHLAEEPK